MPGRSVILLLITLTALAVAAPASASPSALNYSAVGPKVTLTPAGDISSLNLSMFRFEDVPFCGAFPFPACKPDFWEISSPQRMTPNNASCNDTVDGDDTAFRCSPIPTSASVTGTAGADEITATVSFFCTCPIAITANGVGGNDTIASTTGNDNLNGGAGNDSVAAGGGSSDTVSGEDGDDVLSTFALSSSLSGGAGNDDIDTGAGADVIAGDDGNDAINAGAGNDTVTGGAGKDAINGGTGDDNLDGGEDNDSIEGGDGNDALKGAGRRDVLTPGPGTDSVEGGDSTDTVSYEERAAGTTIAIGGGAVSGESGENDTIAGDVENAIGGAEGDRITGNELVNDLEGAAGNDTITPGAGADFVDAGAGDDVIEARDGVPDRIECGDGNDRAVTDEFDTTLGCETVQASRELMADVDNDGIAAPVDCDDRNAARRPGLPDRPGNKIDEDCSGADAPFPRVTTGLQFSFRFSGRSAIRFTKLTLVDVAPGTSIEIRCTGGKRKGCFSGVKKKSLAKAAETNSLASLVNKQKLKKGAVLEVRILRAETIGKVVRYTSKGAKTPSSRIRCLTPGSTRPGSC